MIFFWMGKSCFLFDGVCFCVVCEVKRSWKGVKVLMKKINVSDGRKSGSIIFIVENSSIFI